MLRADLEYFLRKLEIEQDLKRIKQTGRIGTFPYHKIWTLKHGR